MTAFFRLFVYTENIKKRHKPDPYDPHTCDDCHDPLPCEILQLIEFIERNF